MHTVSRLPLHRRIIPRIHNEHLTRFSQIEGHTASFQRDEKDCNFWIFGEPFDGGCTRSRSHMSIQLDTSKSSTTNPPLNQIQETRKLRKYNRLSLEDTQEFKVYLDGTIS